MPYAFMNEERREARRKGYTRWRKKHLAYDLSRQAEYRNNNREKERLRAIRYRKENPESARHAVQQYNKRYPEMQRLRCHRRRCATKTSTTELKLIAEWERKWKKKKLVTCYWCEERFRPSECQTDHVVALVNNGKHEISNVCISCSPCNHKKHAHSLDRWNTRLIHPVLL